MTCLRRHGVTEPRPERYAGAPGRLSPAPGPTRYPLPAIAAPGANGCAARSCRCLQAGHSLRHLPEALKVIDPVLQPGHCLVSGHVNVHGGHRNEAVLNRVEIRARAGIATATGGTDPVPALASRAGYRHNTLGPVTMPKPGHLDTSQLTPGQVRYIHIENRTGAQGQVSLVFQQQPNHPRGGFIMEVTVINQGHCNSG